ncbi:MAG: EAL domain-containing protein [Halieaceae bacterium]|nr:EAL domain-containing protein [Halieaceae bacterium]
MDLHFQPVFSARGQRLLGAEALLRWEHPEHGLISPDRFIDIAERCGQMLRIGEWVLRRGLEQLQAWRAAGFEIGTIMVNVSSVQCQHNDFMARIRAIADAFPPAIVQAITLEITESLYLGNPEMARNLLLGLRDIGFRWSSLRDALSVARPLQKASTAPPSCWRPSSMPSRQARVGQSEPSPRSWLTASSASLDCAWSQ